MSVIPALGLTEEGAPKAKGYPTNYIVTLWPAGRQETVPINKQ